MDLRKVFLERLVSEAKSGQYWVIGFHCEAWPYACALRNTLLRLERGDERAWRDLMELRQGDAILAAFMRAYAEHDWPAVDLEQVAALQAFLARVERRDSTIWDDLVEHGRKRSQVPATWNELMEYVRISDFSRALEKLAQAAEGTFDNLRASDLDFLAEVLQSDAPRNEAKPARERKSRSRIMYIERKAGKLTGAARIGRVTLSKSGNSVYYRGRRFETQCGRGYKSNYLEVETGEEYWISGPRRDGQDRLYGERQPIEIDDDVREEYWTTIRKRPDCVDKKVV
jgi:hypothetical protein